MARPRGGGRPVDARERWADPSRDEVHWEALTRGERSRRMKFARMVSLGVAADVALREVLELALGPVPGHRTQEEFEAYWTDDFLSETAARWQKSRHFRAYAKDQTELARSQLASWAARFAEVLREVANDREASPTSRVKAAQIGLGLAGLVHGEGLPADVRSLKEALQKKTRRVLEVVPDPDEEETPEPGEGGGGE